jgi:hypothetical protein
MKHRNRYRLYMSHQIYLALRNRDVKPTKTFVHELERSVVSDWTSRMSHQWLWGGEVRDQALDSDQCNAASVQDHRHVRICSCAQCRACTFATISMRSYASHDLRSSRQFPPTVPEFASRGSPPSRGSFRSPISRQRSVDRRSSTTTPDPCLMAHTKKTARMSTGGKHSPPFEIVTL